MTAAANMRSDSLLTIWREECKRAPGFLIGTLGMRGLRFDEEALHRIGGALEEAAAGSFQARVAPWMQECFGAEISGDRTERSHRFLEKALELVQAAGCTSGEAHQLVDYVFGRPIGELQQEAGGVMVTLAALCLAQGVDMHAAGEIELERVWTKIDIIRAKQAAKPKHSPLPGGSALNAEPPDDAFPALRAPTEALLTRADADYLRRQVDAAVVVMASRGCLPPAPWPDEDFGIAVWGRARQAPAPVEVSSLALSELTDDQILDATRVYMRHPGGELESWRAALASLASTPVGESAGWTAPNADTLEDAATVCERPGNHHKGVASGVRAIAAAIANMAYETNIGESASGFALVPLEAFNAVALAATPASPDHKQEKNHG
jgi:hypothetical protein